MLCICIFLLLPFLGKTTLKFEQEENVSHSNFYSWCDAKRKEWKAKPPHQTPSFAFFFHHLLLLLLAGGGRCSLCRLLYHLVCQFAYYMKLRWNRKCMNMSTAFLLTNFVVHFFRLTVCIFMTWKWYVLQLISVVLKLTPKSLLGECMCILSWFWVKMWFMKRPPLGLQRAKCFLNSLLPIHCVWQSFNCEWKTFSGDGGEMGKWGVKATFNNLYGI